LAFVVAAAFAVLAMVGWGLIIRRIEEVQWPKELARAAASR
jgi:hypothetical protein